MDEGLFARHALALRMQKNTKEELITHIQEATGVTLDESELTISKKEVTFHLSSVKKSKLVQKDVKGILEEKGYRMRA